MLISILIAFWIGASMPVFIRACLNRPAPYASYWGRSWKYKAAVHFGSFFWAVTCWPYIIWLQIKRGCFT